MSGRRLAPLTSFEDAFVSLSELKLIKVFRQDMVFQKLLQDYAKPDFTSTENIAQTDMSCWLSEKAPGHLITKLIINIGGYTPEQQKTLRDYKARTFVLSSDKVRQHIGAIQDDNSEPSSYKQRGYALHGSLRTDRFRLQLLTFKLNELNAV
ncbi:hypothetical protein BGZ54_005012, partial [Gamsiella multidivaricata]